MLGQPKEQESLTSLLKRYIEAHNRAVRYGDFSQLPSLFAAEATMSFHGLPRPFGPFRGRGAIAAAFTAHPPDDELALGDLEQLEDDAVEASYRWRAHPETPGGRLRLRATQGRIAELTIHIDKEKPP